METIILVAVAIPIVAAVAVLRQRDSTGAWQEAAQQLALEFRGVGKGASLEGDVGSAHIIVDIVERTRERKSVWWTRIRASTDIPPGLLIGGEGFWHQWNETQGGDVVDMAGVAFDEHVIARGAVPQIFALLNSDTRAQFRELERHYRTFVVEGVVHVEHNGVIREAEALARVTRRVATLAMALSLHGPSIADRLGANVATDSNALIRLRNLELLLDRYEGSESARLACQHALGDRSHAIALLAAKQCEEEGIPTLERILNDPKAEHQLRYQSLERLVGLVDLDTAIAILLNIVDNEPTLKTTALVTLASVGFDPGADVLASLLADQDPEGWIAYAQAIAALGRSEMTEPLELLLSQDPEHDVVTLILQALEPEDERFTHSEPLTYPIPEELRLDLEVQSAAQEAMRELAGWSFEEDDEAEAEGLDEPDMSDAPSTHFEAFDDREVDESQDDREEASPQESAPTNDALEVELKPEPD